MTTWPEGIPFFNLRSGYGAQPGENTLRTPMEFGPAKVRRRTTAAPSVITGSAYMTREQAQRFEQFWRDTLKDGAISFTESDGLYRRRNLLVQSEDFSAGWAIPSQLTRTNVASVLPGRTASRFAKTSGASVSIQQSVGDMASVQTFTGVFETHGVDWSSGPTTSVSIWDNTASAHAVLGQASWSLSNAPTATVVSGSGSASLVPMGVGPNGGLMGQFSVSTSAATVGNARSVFIYPTGTDTNTDAVTIHWAQLESAAAFTTYEPVGSSYPATHVTRGDLKAYRIVGVPQFSPMGLGHRVSVQMEVLP